MRLPRSRRSSGNFRTVAIGASPRQARAKALHRTDRFHPANQAEFHSRTKEDGFQPGVRQLSARRIPPPSARLLPLCRSSQLTSPAARLGSRSPVQVSPALVQAIQKAGGNVLHQSNRFNTIQCCAAAVERSTPSPPRSDVVRIAKTPHRPHQCWRLSPARAMSLIAPSRSSRVASPVPASMSVSCRIAPAGSHCRPQGFGRFARIVPCTARAGWFSRVPMKARP